MSSSATSHVALPSNGKSLCWTPTTDVLWCNHRVCKECVPTLMTRTGWRESIFKCPVCRKCTTADVYGAMTIEVGGHGEPLEEYSVLAEDTATLHKYAMDYSDWVRLGEKRRSRSEPSSPVSKRARKKY